MTQRSSASLPSIYAPSNLSTILPLPRTKEEAHQHRIALARKRPEWLGEFCLNFDVQPFHQEWYALWDEAERSILYAPAEHGKTSSIVSYILWSLGHDPSLRFLLIGNTGPQAVKILGQVKENIEENERLHEVFPDLVPEEGRGHEAKRWTDHAILVRRPKDVRLVQKDYSVHALGVGGQKLGARADRIILEDILDFQNTRTEEGRQTTYDWLKRVVFRRRTRRGKLIAVGTAQHEEDAYHRIERELPGWRVVRYRAREGTCVWDAVWPQERLDQVRIEELGEVEYARQFRNVALGEATGYLPVSAARRCQELCDDPPEWWAGEISDGVMRWITGGLDLGASLRRSGARTGLFVLGLGRDGFKRPLHIRSGHWIGVDLLRNVIEVELLFGGMVKEWCVETNAAQVHIAGLLDKKAIVHAVVESEGVRELLEKRIAEGMQFRPGSLAGKVFGLYTTEKRDDARWGIRNIAPEWEALRWRIPRGRSEVDEWLAEAGRYTPEGHPGDRLMAGHFANARMIGQGEPMRNMARSRSVHEVA